jgi:hypothetical protein
MKTSNLNGIFGEEEEEVDTLHVIKPKLVPFEITGEVKFFTPLLNFTYFYSQDASFTYKKQFKPKQKMPFFSRHVD